MTVSSTKTRFVRDLATWIPFVDALEGILTYNDAVDASEDD